MSIISNNITNTENYDAPVYDALKNKKKYVKKKKKKKNSASSGKYGNFFREPAFSQRKQALQSTSFFCHNQEVI